MNQKAANDSEEATKTQQKEPAPKFRKGSALTRAMLERAEDLNMDRYELADATGMTYSYLTLILNGSREVGKISHDRLRDIGKFLGVPFTQVLMLAEIVTPEDFVVEQEHSVEEQLESVYEAMSRHPDWRGLVPPYRVWASMDKQAQVAMGLMFQRVANETLLDLTPIIEVTEEGE